MLSEGVSSAKSRFEVSYHTTGVSSRKIPRWLTSGADSNSS